MKRQTEVQRHLQEACRERGLRLTHQRRVILEALLERDDHPTADEIYEEVQTRIPSMSRTTAYRVLQLLVQVGLARTVCHHGAKVRFEAKTERHHHLVCLQCHRVMDLHAPSLDELPIPDTRDHGFEVSDYSIQFRGVCDTCRRARLKRGRRSEQSQPTRNSKGRTR